MAFPGGKAELSETPVETAIRETLEEVGIDLSTPDFMYLGRNEEANAYKNREKRELLLSLHGMR